MRIKRTDFNNFLSKRITLCESDAHEKLLTEGRIDVDDVEFNASNVQLLALKDSAKYTELKMGEDGEIMKGKTFNDNNEEKFKFSDFKTFLKLSHLYQYKDALDVIPDLENHTVVAKYICSTNLKPVTSDLQKKFFEGKKKVYDVSVTYKLEFAPYNLKTFLSKNFTPKFID